MIRQGETSISPRAETVGSETTRNQCYVLPMTQEQLAEATGMTSFHVNRTLKSLQAVGVIERSSPRSITIGDWRKLADAGDFNSCYLHLKDREPALA